MIFDHIIVSEREKGRHLEPRASLITLVSVELRCPTKEVYKSFLYSRHMISSFISILMLVPGGFLHLRQSV